MKARDKILATMRLLRDNNSVGTLSMTVNRCQAQQKACGWWRITSVRHSGHLVSVA